MSGSEKIPGNFPATHADTVSKLIVRPNGIIDWRCSLQEPSYFARDTTKWKQIVQTG